MNFQNSLGASKDFGIRSSSLDKGTTELNPAEKAGKESRKQTLIFSNLPLSMKKQFLHLLRTNEIDFQPSIRNGFVEAKIILDKQHQIGRPSSKNNRVIIGEKEYRQLLGHKYAEATRTEVLNRHGS